jgi:hypothetical protein
MSGVWLVLTQNQIVIASLSRTWMTCLFVFPSAAEKMVLDEKVYFSVQKCSGERLSPRLQFAHEVFNSSKPTLKPA